MSAIPINVVELALAGNAMVRGYNEAMKNIIDSLDLGNSVAEFDTALEHYFVETEPFRSLFKNERDVIAGDKGTGKTAIFRILQKRYRQIPELKGVEIITAFNPSGNPVFQRLVQEHALTEGQYRSVWKAYVLSLVGNWALNIAGENISDSFKALHELLNRSGLRVDDDTPQTIFGKLINSFRRAFNPQSAEVGFTFSETGIPIVTPKVEFGANEVKSEEVSHEDALRLLDGCLGELGVDAWVVLDRLDEAFQGFPDIEIPALRALLRTYLDMVEFDHIRLKLFVRRDLFRKVIGDGFVNLTHVNARKKEIIWDEDDLLNLLCTRIRESGDFLKSIGAENSSNEEILKLILPAQVDIGEKRPTTWNWIMSRIRDGNHVKPPRNLIDLITKAKEAQLRREDREARNYEVGLPVIESDSLKRALSRLSEERVEDTLLAEAGDAVGLIEKFKNQKSEHNRVSLKQLLDVDGDELDYAIRRLEEIGFLEETGQTFKVPMLYRDGMNMVQGKAFEVTG